jgi:predicted  nucleic acid-binding Zn-ribbon protein
MIRETQHIERLLDARDSLSTAKSFKDSINKVILATELLRKNDSLSEVARNSSSTLNSLNEKRIDLEETLSKTSDENEKMKIQLEILSNEIKKYRVEAGLKEKDATELTVKLDQEKRMVEQLNNDLKIVSEEVINTKKEIAKFRNLLSGLELRIRGASENKIINEQSLNSITTYIKELENEINIEAPLYRVTIYVNYKNGDERANQFIAYMMSRDFPGEFNYIPQTSVPYGNSGILCATYDNEFLQTLKESLNGSRYEAYGLKKIVKWQKDEPRKGKAIIVLDF